MEAKEANETRQRINTSHGNKDSQVDEDKMRNNESRADTKTKVANEMKTLKKNKRRSSKATALLEKEANAAMQTK
jgi:hypothetical protein